MPEEIAVTAIAADKVREAIAIDGDIKSVKLKLCEKHHLLNDLLNGQEDRIFIIDGQSFLVSKDREGNFFCSPIPHWTERFQSSNEPA